MHMKDTKIKILKETNNFFLFDLRELERCIKLIVDYFGLDKGVEIKLTNDREIERLNSEFLNIQAPTNVLSFPAEEEDFLGSICVSVDTIMREAFLYDQDIKEYFLRMLIHGMLHLMGYEHGDEMFEYTDILLEHLKENHCIV